MMNEITLIKTFEIRNSSNQDSLDYKLYHLLMNATQKWLNIRFSVPNEKIPDWFLASTPKKEIYEELMLTVATELRSVENYRKSFFIPCRNYSSLETILAHVRVFVDEHDRSIYFVLFFKSHSLFYVRSISNSLMVTPVSSGREIYHVDMSNESVSISIMEQLIKK